MKMDKRNMHLALLFVTVFCIVGWIYSKGGLRNSDRLSLPFHSIFLTETNVDEAKEGIPVTAIPKRVWHHYDQNYLGYSLPILTMMPAGGLGNVMGEYATLYALGKAYNVTVFLHPNSKNILGEIFPNISFPLIPDSFPSIDSNDWEKVYPTMFNYYPIFEAVAAGILGPKLFVLLEYPFEMYLFNAYRKDILRDFTFHPVIQNVVSEFWIENENRKDAASVLVGMHIRLQTYIGHAQRFQGHVPGKDYYRRAMDYYRTRFGKVLFVLASDDEELAKKMIDFEEQNDVIMAPGTRNEDMAIVSSCNHTIISIGTYGFFCGYLSGGLVVYPDINFTYNFPTQRLNYDLGNMDFFIPIKAN